MTFERVHRERPIIEYDSDTAEPGEAASLKIALEHLGVAVDCKVSGQHSAKIVQLGGIAMATLGPVLMLWVGASTNYPAWVIIALALSLVSTGATISLRAS